MRSANKGLKNKQNIIKCGICGESKLMHHMCACEIPTEPTAATKLVLEMQKKNATE
jgi:ribosomal protein L32